MRVNFIGKLIKAFKRIKSIELQRSSLTTKRNMPISTKLACKETMINPWHLSGRSVQNVSRSYTVDVYLTTPLNPRRLHTIACRTFSCQLASAEKNNIIISNIKKVLSGYPHEWSGFHTKTNSRRKYFMASSSATLCASQCSFAIILWSFK